MCDIKQYFMPISVDNPDLYLWFVGAGKYLTSVSLVRAEFQHTGYCDNTGSVFRTHTKPKSYTCIFIHNYCSSRPIISKFCTKHGSHTAVLCTKFENDWLIRICVTGMVFRSIVHIATSFRSMLVPCVLLVRHAQGKWFDQYSELFTGKERNISYRINGKDHIYYRIV